MNSSVRAKIWKFRGFYFCVNANGHMLYQYVKFCIIEETAIILIKQNANVIN